MTTYLNPSTHSGGSKQIVVPERQVVAEVDEAPFDDTEYVRINGEWRQVTEAGMVPDTLAPNPPTNLAAFGSVNAAIPSVDYELTWDAPLTNTDSSALTDLAYYVVRWRYEGTGPWTSFVSNDESFLLPGLTPGMNVEWAVLARDTSGNDSTWATDLITGIVDLDAPETPSTPGASSRLGTIRVTWDGLDNLGNPMPADFDHLEVFVSTAMAGPWTYIGRLSGAGSVIVTDVPVGEIRYFATTAFDTADNASPLSSVATVTTLGVTGPDIEANAITANMIDSGTLNASVAVTGELTAGDPLGARVTINSAGITQYAADGSVRANLPTDPDQPDVFEGDLVAASLTIQDRFALRGETNEISKGSALALSSGTSAPTSPPSLQVAYEQYDGNVSEYLFAPRGFHHEADGGDRWLMSTFFGDTHMLTPAGGYAFPKVTTSTGASYATFDVQDSTVVNTPTGRRVVGIGWKNTAGGVAQMGMQSFDPAPISGNDSPTGPTWMAGLYAGFVSSWGSDHKIGRCISPAGSLASLENQVAEVEWLDNASQKTNYALKLRRWAVTDSGIVQQGSTVNVTGLWSNASVAGVVYGSSARMGFPGADQNIWLVFGGGTAWAYSATGTRLADFDFPLNTGADHIDVAGSTAPGVNGFVGFRSLPNTPNGDGYRLVTKYTNNHWVTGTPSKWWVSATWYDPDATGGTHETAQGPRSVITMAKRASLLVTVPPFPSRPSPTTTDDVTSAKVYIGRGDVDPGRTKMELLGQVNSPNRGLVVGDVTFPVALAAVPPPAASNFPQSSPGRITSSDGVSWVLSGDGTVDLQGSTFGPAGTTLSSPGGSYLSVVSPMLLTGDVFIRNTCSLVLGDFADPNTGYFYSRKKAADGTSTIEEVSGLLGDTPIQIFRRNGADISKYTKTLTAHLFEGQHVYSDKGFRSPLMAVQEFAYTDASVAAGLFSTISMAGARGGQGVFVAPPSGVVRIDFAGWVKTGTAGQFAAWGIEVRTGATIGSGTVIHTTGANDAAINYDTQYINASSWVMLTGLTPGASYNLRMGIWTTASSNSSWTRGKAIVTPSP